MTTDADQRMAQISVYGRITNPYFCNTYTLLDSTMALLDSTSLYHGLASFPGPVRKIEFFRWGLETRLTMALLDSISLYHSLPWLYLAYTPENTLISYFIFGAH